MAELITTSLASDTALRGYWRMEGNFNDSGPNSYNLTATNGATFSASGKYGQAGSFTSASSQYATIAHASIPNLEISGSQTWVCWVKQTTLLSYQDAVSLSATAGTNVRGLTTSADNGGTIYFTIPGLTTNIQVSSGLNIITTGTYYHLAGVYNSATTTLKCYINGVEVGSVTASGSATAYTDGGFAIGAHRGGPANFTNGLIDDAALFARPLSVSEIQLLSSPPSGGAFLFNMI